MGSPASSERGTPRRRLATLLLALAVAWSLPACGIDKLVSSPGTDDDSGSPGGGGGNGGGTQSLSLVFITQPTNTVEKEPIKPDVQVAVRDQSGNTVASFTGTIRLEIAANPSNGHLQGDTGRQPSSGVAVFDNLRVDEPGNGYTLRATASGVSSAISASFNITRQRPDDRVIAVVSGSGQQDTVGATLGVPYVVQVRREDGTPVPGVEITWAVASGGGIVTPNVVATDGAGMARATHQLGTTAGDQTVTASAAVLGSPVTFTTAARHGAAARIAVVQQPTDVATGATIAPPVRVRIVDRFDNLATTYAAAVTVDIVPLTGTPLATLMGTLTQTPAGGEAVFPDLQVSLPGIGYKLRLVTGSLTVDTGPFTVL